MKSIEEFDEMLKNDKHIEELEDQLEQMIAKFGEVATGKVKITLKEADTFANQGYQIKDRLEYLKGYRKLKGWD